MEIIVLVLFGTRSIKLEHCCNQEACIYNPGQVIFGVTPILNAAVPLRLGCSALRPTMEIQVYTDLFLWKQIWR